MQLFYARPGRVHKAAAGTIESVGRARDNESDGNKITEVVSAVVEAI
jgi:hypothetical protein